jgi:hypothetical protein
MKKIVDGFENYSIDHFGNVINIKTNKAIKQSLYPDGRVMVELWKNNKRKHCFVHRLLALNFIPNEFDKPQINHINGIPNDNRLENLEWVTDSENKLHAHKLGLIVPKRIKVFQFCKNGYFIEEHLSILHAAKKTKVDRKSISLNIQGKYSHAGGFIWKLNK